MSPVVSHVVCDDGACCCVADVYPGGAGGVVYNQILQPARRTGQLSQVYRVDSLQAGQDIIQLLVLCRDNALIHLLVSFRYNIGAIIYRRLRS